MSGLILLLISIALSVALASAAGATDEDRCRCANKIILLHRKDDYRSMFSPEFPRPYCGNLDCKWRIVAPDNSTRIEFFSRNTDLREDRDFLHFYDTHIEDGWIARKAVHSCTGTGPCEFLSSGRYITIRLVTSEGEPDRYGFQGTVRAKTPEDWFSSFWNVAILASLIVAAAAIILVSFYLIRSRRRARDQDPLLAKLQAKSREEQTKHSGLPSNPPIIYNVLQ